MGGCDLAGQLCKYYTHNHRTLKWWKRLLVTILHICLLNATIVYNSITTNSRLSGLEFRVKVIEGLLSTWKYNPAQHANQLSSSRPVNIHTFLDAVARNGSAMLREISQPMIQVYSPCNLCPPPPPFNAGRTANPTQH